MAILKKELPFPRPIIFGIHVTGQITIIAKPELRAKGPLLFDHILGEVPTGGEWSL